MQRVAARRPRFRTPLFRVVGVSGLMIAGGCAAAAEQPVEAGSGVSPSPPAMEITSELVELHTQHRMPGLDQREFTHRELWSVIDQAVAGSDRISREEIGRSAEGRPIYLMRFGEGETRVLLWSQMHGDESTASMALADIFHLLAASPNDPLVQRLANELTIFAIPMLNPDGAERFQRRNALGIDINRDARALSTPEGRVLREAQRRLQPDFGFNLHDQNVRTRVGGSNRTAAMALLAPPVDAARSDTPVRQRAKHVAALLRQAMEPLVPGHIARYDETFNPRAFGDLMGTWGTSTVLIESGGWRDDPEKQHLRKVNFVAILAALDAIATGAYTAANPSWYETLPENGRAADDLLIRGGTLVLPGMPPLRADLAIDYRDPLEKRGGRIVDVGDLAETVARDTVDAAGMFVHPTADALESNPEGAGVLHIGAPASFMIRRGADAASGAVWMVQEGQVQRIP
jgi:hypothetical protein